MTPKLKEQYQRLQVLVFALQLERWPLEEEISRDDALALVKNFAPSLGIDPEDPELLLKLALKLSQVLIQEEAPSIPPNLGELVEIYEKHLKEEREKRSKKLLSSQKTLQEQIKNQLAEKFESFKQNPELAEEIGFQLSEEVRTRLPPVAIEAAFKKEDYQTTWQEIEPEASRELKRAGVTPESEKIKAIGQSLIKATFEQAKDLAATPRKPISIKKEIEKPPLITPAEEKVIQAEKALETHISSGFARAGLPFYSPQEHQALSRAAKNIITAHLTELPKKEITQSEYERLLRKTWPRIREKFEKRGLSFSESQAENFIKNFVEKSQQEAVVLTTTAPQLLPKEAMAKLEAEEEGVALWPAYPLLQPQLVLSYFKRAVFGPPKKAIEIAITEALPEEKPILEEMVEKGLFAEDLETSIARLKETGLPETHPSIQKLETKKSRFLEVQKTEKVLSDGTAVLKDKPFVRVLKRYYEASKLAGKHQIYEPETRMYLPRTSPAPISSRLQQFLNKIGLATRLYQKVKLGPGKTVIRPYLSEKFMRFITAHRYSSFSHLFGAIYRKTLGRIFAILGKSGVGETAKVGLKTGAIWFATKLGFKTGIKKLATWAFKLGLSKLASVLGTPLAGAITFIATTILPWLKKKIKKLMEKPERAVLVGLATLGLGLLSPFLPLKLILTGIGGVLSGLGFLSGAAKWIGGITIKAGSLVTGAVGTISTFITGLTTISLPATVSAIPVAVVVGVIFLTIFAFLTIGAAFAPSTIPTPEGAIQVSAYIGVFKTVAPKSQFENNELPVEITYTLTVTAKQQKLINVKITDKTTVTKETNPPSVPERSWTVDEIETTWSENYNLTLDNRFQDSLITNYVTVTADVENGPVDEKATTSLTVIAGSPPQDCPSGWPMPHGRLVQGPRCPNTHGSCEAIDIVGGTVGITPIIATHQGIVSTHPSPAGVYGRYVDVTSVCGGIIFTSRYAHLTIINVNDGEKISKGTQVGTYGNSGDPRRPGSYNPHLHYEFMFMVLQMQSPYIPKSLPVPCCSFSACGSISW